MVCFSLLTMPAVQAQSQLGQALQGAIGIIQGGMQSAIQQQQAAIAQAQLQQQMASLQPQMVPSKYHPQCAVAKAVTDFPEGACKSQPPDPQEAAMFRELAVSYESFFQNLLAESQNSPRPVGVQCIEEANKQVDAQMQDKINGLQALINQVKKESQLFEQNQQKIKEEMDKNRDILYGNKSRNAETMNTNHLAEFTPACQTFYKNSGQTTVLSKGFAGLRDDSETMKNQAGTFDNNRQAYIDDLNNQLTAIRQGIKKDGFADFSANMDRAAVINGKTFEFGSMRAIMGAKAQDFQKDMEIIQRDLAAVGFNVTEDDLNADFNERMSRFASGAGEFFKKEAINDCVNGRGTTGIGLSTDQILQGLRHRRADGAATSLQWYRTALENILNSDAFINDKMLAIQRLDKRLGVGEVTVTIQGADGNSRAVTPYDLYRQQIEVCEARVAQDDTFSTVDGLRQQGGSVAERIADAERALKKAINLEKNFSQELTQAVFDRVVNCQGIQKSEEKCMPDSNGVLSALNPGDDQFCIDHGSSCANQARACYIETDTIVKKRQEQMKTLAAGYNERVSALIARQEFFLNQIKAQVVADAEFIKRFVPGTAYTFPEDLFVKMPQEKLDPEYGVALAGDINNIEDLTKDLPTKLEGLKRMLEGQQRLLAKELGDYLNDQRGGMSKDAGKWTDLKATCEAAIQAHNDMMAQQAQQQQEQFGESNNFCQRFNAIAQNPAAGCGQAEQLADEAFQVSAGLANPGAVRASALEFQNFCNSVQNEEERGSEDSSTQNERDFEMLGARCTERGGTEGLLTELREEIEAAMESSLPSDLHASAREYLSGEASRSLASVNSELRNTSFFNNYLRPFNRLRTPSSVTNSLEGDHLANERSDIEERIEGLSTDKPNFCEAYEIVRRVESYNSCADPDGERSTQRCFDDKREQEFPEVRSGAIAEAASLVGASFDDVVSSQSRRIGERMNGTPCMAQQGFNGSNGFDISNFDLGILGAQGMDTINALTR